MEEKAQVAKKEADIHRALKQLRDERKRLQPEEDALKSWSLQQTPKETVADLQVLLSRLHEERHRLKVEREQLAEVFALISSGRKPGMPRRARKATGGETGKKIEGPRLRMILEPGTATSASLSELLLELSALNRQLGGPGVDFVVSECRTWRLSAKKQQGTSPTGGTKPNSEKASSVNADRSFVEIYAVPMTPADPNAKTAGSHWDHFTASLFMVLRLDAGQANYFDLAEVASREHPSHVLATDAAVRAARRSAKAAPTIKPAAPDASVDAVNVQLQRIEELRRKLEREDSLILELAPAVAFEIEDEQSPPATGPAAVAKSPVNKRRRIAKIAGVATAAVLLLAALIFLLRPSSAHEASPEPTPPAAEPTNTPAQ